MKRSIISTDTSAKQTAEQSRSLNLKKPNERDEQTRLIQRLTLGCVLMHVAKLFNGCTWDGVSPDAVMYLAMLIMQEESPIEAKEALQEILERSLGGEDPYLRAKTAMETATSLVEM